MCKLFDRKKDQKTKRTQPIIYVSEFRSSQKRNSTISNMELFATIVEGLKL